MSQPVGLVHHDQYQYQQQHQYHDQDSEDDGLGGYDHYYNLDESDHGSATALAAQTSDTLGASAPGPQSDPPPTKDPSRSPIVTAQPHGVDEHQRQSQHQYQHQHQHQHERQQSQQALVAPGEQSRLPSQLDQDVAAHHEAHAHAQPHARPSRSSQQSQPYRPESVSAHASSQPAPSPLRSPRSTRSHSLAASLASSYGTGSQSPIRRKPLSPTASPLAVRFSSKQIPHMPPLPPIPHDLQQPDSGFFSLNSPDLYDLASKSPKTEENLSVTRGPSLLPTSLEEQQSDGDYLSDYNWPSPPAPTRAGEPDTRNNIPDANPAYPQTGDSRQPKGSLTNSDGNVTALASRQSTRFEAESHEPVAANNRNTSSNMSTLVRKSIPQQLDLEHPNPDIQQHSATLGRPPDSASSLNKPLPKSPPISPVRSPLSSSKLSSFFGWGVQAPPSNNEDPNVKDYSPIPSPVSDKRDSLPDEYPVAKQESVPIQPLARQGSALGYIESYFPTPSNSYTPVSPVVEIEEMEDELKAISAELASSIRREMDLEDLVERLQADVSNPQAPGKRTSDYFSDSGYSSARYSESDQSKEEVAQIQRRAEQEKAQLRLELTSKLQEERGRRNELDHQIKELADKASQADAAQMTSKDADARVKELEKTCEDLRRRLSEEKQVKDNFEDLLSALKGELQNASLERDNLRDEVVPQLRARVDGLEAQQTENEKLAYETTKMQQELQALRDSKTKHDSLARLRSSSITGQPLRLSRPPSGIAGLSRSNTVKSGHIESRETLSERLKDVEAQRDALHNALKNLLDRQDFQNRENEKKIKHLETERDRLLSTSPRKAGFEKEVTTLREEVSVLRRRAEEAIEQKWQVEKGLIGLKSDLDRAEEEITSLKSLLSAKDILIPDAFSRYSNSSATGNVAATSSSLEKAYKDLQKSYQDALDRVKDMELGGTSASQDERTRLAMQRLEQTLSAALLERDDSRLEAAALQDQVDSLKASEKSHLNGERDLADQLRDSANRVEELTQQVRAQLAINSNLRSRLSDTIARGEATQKANKDRLATMQNRMRVLEDQIVAAQTAAEERVNRHEEELSSLRDANNGNLQRRPGSNGGLRSPRLFPPKSPLSPLLSPNGGRFPRMLSSHSRNSSRARPSTAEQQDEEDERQVEILKTRIAELEKSLVNADFEMQEVVSRMNTAQIEVMTLQEERETAARETKKLQKQLEEERIKAFQEKFNTISG